MISVIGGVQSASPGGIISHRDSPSEREASLVNSNSPARKGGAGRELSDVEIRKIEELKRIDREVRQHEHAHLSAGGNLVRGGASFDFVTGPDGKQYAVSGEVSIDTAPVPDDPEATAQKAQQIRQAALAPANPSAQDRQVASNATQMEAQARVEILQRAQEERTGQTESNSSDRAPDTERNSRAEAASEQAVASKQPEETPSVNAQPDAAGIYRRLDQALRADF